MERAWFGPVSTVPTIPVTVRGVTGSVTVLVTDPVRRTAFSTVIGTDHDR